MSSYNASLRVRAAAELELRRRRAANNEQPFRYDNPADFIENEVYDPDSGKILVLHPEQRAVLESMSERDAAGNFKHSLWLYSAPKKSAKTTIGAGVALWQAWQVPRGEIYIIGNDQRQADNRMAQIIRYTILHNPRMKSRVNITKSSFKMELDNGTRIDIIPVDPRGESGMNPSGLFWTEAWGAMGTRAEMLWSEATLSPTRSGQSFKFVESYAGYSGESTVLERLYNGIVKNGAAHPTIPELYTNGSSIAYWCTRRYLPWQQNPDYYAQEALSKPPSEFSRQHENEWQSATSAFIPLEWWDACEEALPPLQSSELMVIALDAATSDDCFAIVGVTRRGDQTYERYSRVWYPPKGGKLDFSGEDSPEAEIRRLCKTYKIAEVCYDPYQLHSLAMRLSQELNIHFAEFGQGVDRLIGDKQLYDSIRDRSITHSGNPVLREYVMNANRKDTGEQDKLRIVKRSQESKIDACVALAMAHARARFLNIG